MNKKTIIKNFYEQIVSKKQLEEISEYVSQDCVFRNDGHLYHAGIKGMCDHINSIIKTYPDLTISVSRQFKDGDYVISEVVMSGTHKGKCFAIEPSNKKISINAINIDKVIEGKIVEHSGAAKTFEAFLENKLI